MNEDTASNNRNSSDDGTLIANGPMAISESARIRSKYGNNALPGGTEIVDFNARVSFSNGNVTVTPPTIEVGGNPKDALFRMLLKKHGGEVATDISNNFSGSTPDTPQDRRFLINKVQDAFDVGMAKKVIEWCDANPNGASFALGKVTVGYDQKMIEQMRQNAADRVKELRWHPPTYHGKAQSDSLALVDGKESVNRQFAQALKGTNGDRDAAAVAVETISKAPGYKPDQGIAVVQGKNGGMIVSQGEGDTGLNLAVPQAKQGDYERVSTQMAQAPTQVALQQDAPERARTM